MSGNEFSVLAASRHSVRSFQDTQIAPEVLEAILEDARCAPSWSNTRPYKLALASGHNKPGVWDRPIRPNTTGLYP